MKKQNADWLENRPMWKIDKRNKILLKNPTRWLSSAKYRYASRNGWLDMRAVIYANEIRNSFEKRAIIQA